MEFRRANAARPPASELIAALLAEYDVVRGRHVRNGPSATPYDFSPPRGAYLVGYLGGMPVCGGGVKAIGAGVGEIKRMYVAPAFRRRGFARGLLVALEGTACDLGHELLRLDCQAATWPLYAAAGYRQIEDYNGNPNAEFWAEKRL